MNDYLQAAIRLDSLAGVRAPSKVYVRGRVESPNAVQSPISGARAALLQWQMLVREPPTGERIGFSGLLGKELAIKTPHATVRVLTEGLTLYVQGNTNARRLEPKHLNLARELTGADADTSATLRLMIEAELLYYSEQCVYSEMLVRLRAVVAPVEGVTFYRHAGGPPFVTRADLEAPVLSQDVPEFA